MIVGFTGLVAAGAGVHYAISDDENRQKGFGYWVGKSLISASGGALCGTIFEMTCGAAGKSVLETAWKVYRY